MDKRIFYFLFISLISYSAAAYEVFPEFRTLSEDETTSLSGPERYDSEYQSDARTYTKPVDWQYEFLSNPMAFDFSAGSISRSRFNVDNRLKLTNELTKNFRFRFLYFEQRDLDEEREGTLVELSQKIGKIRVAGFGEVSSRKSKDDFGLSLSTANDDSSTYTLFINWADFSRNLRNEDSDEFAESPLGFGFVYRAFEKSSREFLEFAIRAEKMIQWQFSDLDLAYKYYSRYFGLYGRSQVRKKDYFVYRLSLKRKYEEHLPGITSSISAENVLFDNGELLLQYRATNSFRNIWDFVGGTQLVIRNWQYSVDQIRQTSLLPFIRFERQIACGQRLDHVGIGLEMTVYKAKGPDARRSETDEDNRLEGRGNLSYSFLFEKSELRWQFTFDVDKLGTGETWEGGSGQYRMTF